MARPPVKPIVATARTLVPQEPRKSIAGWGAGGVHGDGDADQLKIDEKVVRTACVRVCVKCAVDGVSGAQKNAISTSSHFALHLLRVYEVPPDAERAVLCNEALEFL